MFPFGSKKSKPKPPTCFACKEPAYDALLINSLEGDPVLCARCILLAVTNHTFSIKRDEIPNYKKGWMR